MIRTIEISRIIYDTIKNIQIQIGEDTRKVPVYPVVAENGAKLPFIVYTRDSVASVVCKDGIYADEVTFTINIISATYWQSLTLAQAVRSLIQVRRIDSMDMTISNIRLTNINEYYDNEAYVQSLQFTVSVTNS